MNYNFKMDIGREGDSSVRKLSVSFLVLSCGTLIWFSFAVLPCHVQKCRTPLLWYSLTDKNCTESNPEIQQANQTGQVIMALPILKGSHSVRPLWRGTVLFENKIRARQLKEWQHFSDQFISVRLSGYVAIFNFKRSYNLFLLHNTPEHNGLSVRRHLVLVSPALCPSHSRIIGAYLAIETKHAFYSDTVLDSNSE